MKRNGFSLVELLVSMLIVSIAMLGFAALQAYSSRALNSSYQRTEEVSVFQDLIKVFQVSNRPLSNELVWNNENKFKFNCSDGNLGEILKNKNGKPISLVRGIEAACAKATASRTESRINISLSRIKLGESPLFSYTLQINMAYKLKKSSYVSKEDKTLDEVDFCPFEEPEKMNAERIKYNIACSHVEVML